MAASAIAIVEAMNMLKSEYNTFCDQNDIDYRRRKNVIHILERIETEMHFRSKEELDDSFYALQAAKDIVGSAARVDLARKEI